MWVVNYAAPGVAIAGLGVTYYALMRKGLTLERQNEEYTAYIMDILSKSQGGTSPENLGPKPSRSWEGLSHHELETRFHQQQHRRKNTFRSRSLTQKKHHLSEDVPPSSLSSPKCRPSPVPPDGTKVRRRSLAQKPAINNNSVPAPPSTQYNHLKTKLQAIEPHHGSSEGLNVSILSDEVGAEEEVQVGLVRSTSAFSSSSSSSGGSDFTPRTRVSLGNLRAKPPPPPPPPPRICTDVEVYGRHSRSNLVPSEAGIVPDVPPPFPPPKLVHSPRRPPPPPPIPPRRTSEKFGNVEVTSEPARFEASQSSPCPSPRACRPCVAENLQGNSNEREPDTNENTTVVVLSHDSSNRDTDGNSGEGAGDTAAPVAMETSTAPSESPKDECGVSESESGSMVTIVQVSPKRTAPAPPTVASSETDSEITMTTTENLPLNLDDDIHESVSEIQVPLTESNEDSLTLTIIPAAVEPEDERVSTWLRDSSTTQDSTSSYDLSSREESEIIPPTTTSSSSPAQDSAQFLFRPSSSESAISTCVQEPAGGGSTAEELPVSHYEHRRKPRSRSCDYIRIHELAVEDILSQSETLWSGPADFLPPKRAHSLPDVLQLDVRYGQIPSWDMKGGGDADKSPEQLSILLPIQLFNRNFRVNLTPDVVVTIAFLVSLCIITFQIWPAPGQRNPWYW